jgi:hypothetical protein
MKLDDETMERLQKFAAQLNEALAPLQTTTTVLAAVRDANETESNIVIQCNPPLAKK